MRCRYLPAVLLAMGGQIALAGEPPPADAASIAAGKVLFQRHCTSCHGEDGRAQVDVISDATDLTDPEAYYSGSTPAEMFTSIRDGAGVSMPPFSFELKDEADIWHLVHFVRSLWATQGDSDDE